MADQLTMFGEAVPADRPRSRGWQKKPPVNHALLVETAATILEATPGSRVIYHTGDIATDRHHAVDVETVASAYLEAAEAGLVVLAQRRLSPGRSEYIAIRTGRRLSGHLTKSKVQGGAHG